jgi:hypothetical protein
MEQVKVVEYHDLLNESLFQTSDTLIQAWHEIEVAINATDWPHGSGTFTIYPESGKKRGQGNGVKPIKLPCMSSLKAQGWDVEKLPDLGSSVLRTGDLDALKNTSDGYIAFEWETGNISSSHRAINKLLLTMQETNTLGSFLVIPSDILKPYLTDRIGNIGELRPYFPLWRNLPDISGAMRVIVVEHDNTSFDVPRIPKGTDGRAKQ